MPKGPQKRKRHTIFKHLDHVLTIRRRMIAERRRYFNAVLLDISERTQRIPELHQKYIQALFLHRAEPTLGNEKVMTEARQRYWNSLTRLHNTDRVWRYNRSPPYNYWFQPEYRRFIHTIPPKTLDFLERARDFLRMETMYRVDDIYLKFDQTYYAPLNTANREFPEDSSQMPRMKTMDPIGLTLFPDKWFNARMEGYNQAPFISLAKPGCRAIDDTPTEDVPEHCMGQSSARLVKVARILENAKAREESAKELSAKIVAKMRVQKRNNHLTQHKLRDKANEYCNRLYNEHRDECLALGQSVNAARDREREAIRARQERSDIAPNPLFLIPTRAVVVAQAHLEGRNMDKWRADWRDRTEEARRRTEDFIRSLHRGAGRR